MMRMIRYTWVALVFVVALSAGCEQLHQPAQAPDTRADDEAAIRAAATEWANTVPAKDAHKFASFYAPDAAVYPFNAPKVQGTDAIHKYWTDLMNSPGFGGSVKTVKIEASRGGDLAYETGTFEMTLNDPKGKPMSMTGKYVVVWKKQPDGAWKAIADIFNTDK